MQDETRVAVISMIIDNEESAASINALLHDCREYIIGRMGIPYREKGLNIINVVLDAPMDAVSALSGKLGRLPGVTAKAVYSKLPPRKQRKDRNHEYHKKNQIGACRSPLHGNADRLPERSPGQRA